MRHLTLIALLLLSQVTFAQSQITKYNYNRDRRGNNGGGGKVYYGEAGSALTIFSESGDQFQLILNGVRQNSYPQNRIRIEDLPQVENEIQIIFDDNVTPSITKRIAFLDPVDGKAVNLTLKLVRDRGGYPRLCFHKLTSLEQHYYGEQGEYIMHYGHDDIRNGGRNNVPPPPPAPMAMDNATFSAALQSIKSSNWDETRLSTAQTIANNNYFTTDQVILICKVFSWEENKLAFAKYAFKRTIDNNNYFKVNTVFSWDDNKKALNDYVTANR